MRRTGSGQRRRRHPRGGRRRRHRNPGALRRCGRLPASSGLRCSGERHRQSWHRRGRPGRLLRSDRNDQRSAADLTAGEGVDAHPSPVDQRPQDPRSAEPVKMHGSQSRRPSHSTSPMRTAAQPGLSSFELGGGFYSLEFQRSSQHLTFQELCDVDAEEASSAWARPGAPLTAEREQYRRLMAQGCELPN